MTGGFVTSTVWIPQLIVKTNNLVFAVKYICGVCGKGSKAEYRRHKIHKSRLSKSLQPKRFIKMTEVLEPSGAPGKYVPKRPANFSASTEPGDEVSY